MIFDERLGAAVIAVDPGFGVLELRGHGLSFNVEVVLSKGDFHVDHAFAADRAFERALHVLFPAGMVDAVAASHEDDRLW